MIQLIEYKDHIFHINVHGKKYKLIGLNLYDEGIIPIRLKLKSGSTLGWNLSGKFVSYKQLKKAIHDKFN